MISHCFWSAVDRSIWSFSNDACSFTFFRLPARLLKVAFCLIFRPQILLHPTLYTIFYSFASISCTFLYIPCSCLSIKLWNLTEIHHSSTFLACIYSFQCLTLRVFIKFCFGSQTYLHGPTCSWALILFAIIYWNSLTFYLLFRWRITVKTIESKMYSFLNPNHLAKHSEYNVRQWNVLLMDGSCCLNQWGWGGKNRRDTESHYTLLVTEGGQISKDNEFQNLSVII